LANSKGDKQRAIPIALFCCPCIRVRAIRLHRGIEGTEEHRQGMQQAQLIEDTVRGLGYQFVEANWAAAGLLRVTIDRSDDASVTVEDCERVSRQLQYALEVEGLDYKRLEVSSPGLDRLLRTPEDMRRFAGQAVDVTLRLPFQGRKKYRGILQGVPAEGEGGLEGSYSIAWDEALLAGLERRRPGANKNKPAAAGRRATLAQEPQELRFSMAEAREVRLVPLLDFRGRKS
jgi:ribosome maturation factor RimP